MSGMPTGYYGYGPPGPQNPNPAAGSHPLPLPSQVPHNPGQTSHFISPTQYDVHTHSPGGQGPPSHDHEPGPSSLANTNGKRQLAPHDHVEFKKPRTDMDDDDDGPESMSAHEDGDSKASKPKSTRGSRACTVCRRLKMKCVGAEHGPPCKRCAAGNHDCIFEESNRGKRSTKKQEILAQSIKKMERTLDAVVRHMGNGALPEDLAHSRSPSPEASGYAPPQTYRSAPSPSNTNTHRSSSSHMLNRPAPSPHMTASSLSHSGPRSQSRASIMVQSPSSPKLHSLPDSNLNPLGLLAEASLANSRQVAQSPQASRPGVTPMSSQQNVGVASDLYFKPGPMTILPLRRLYIERANQPEMLSFTSSDEVHALFKIFFDHMHMHASLLDPKFHDPSRVCSRSPFLLTAICAVAARFYEPRSDLHIKLSELARRMAFEVPAQGFKSVEIVQAYLILALWGSGPAERYEMDRTWMLLGMGIRMATDLNLHRRVSSITPETADDRTRDNEIRNRERTWIMAFILDRSFSAQLGKPHSIQEDTIIRTVLDWSQHELTIPSDFPVAAYAELQRIQSRCLDILSAAAGVMQPDMDYLVVIRTMETQLVDWLHTVSNAMDSRYEYGVIMLKFYFNYNMLVINSFGLQNAMDHAPINIGHFFMRCHSTATTCATTIRDVLGPRGYMRYSPDSHFVLCSYVVLSLLKLVRPEFQASTDHESATLKLVGEVADWLERLAVSPMHTPALYSTFLRALLNNKMNSTPPEGQTHSSDPQRSGMDPSLQMMQPQQQQHHPDVMVSNGGDQHVQVQVQAHAHPTADYQYNNYQQQQLPPAYPEFQFAGEMGPVADMSTFPPTMAPVPTQPEDMLSSQALFASGFWDNVLVPGYANPMEGLSGGFVYGIGGSGYITPRMGMSPNPSGANSPAHLHLQAAANGYMPHGEKS